MNSNGSISKEKEIEELVAILDSKFFKALSEPVRINILRYLILNGRSDIAAIAADLPQDRSVISRHLQLMYDAGILDCEKITRHVYYEINGVFFMKRLETILEKIKACIPECCPGS